MLLETERQFIPEFRRSEMWQMSLRRSSGNYRSTISRNISRLGR